MKDRSTLWGDMGRELGSPASSARGSSTKWQRTKCHGQNGTDRIM